MLGGFVRESAFGSSTTPSGMGSGGVGGVSSAVMCLGSLRFGSPGVRSVDVCGRFVAAEVSMRTCKAVTGRTLVA